MEKINRLLEEPEFKRHVQKNLEAEATRIFCRHDMAHYLDVCRIAWILTLERGLKLDKEVVYAAGLLHDTGRWLEYETGEDHARASARLALPILQRCGFTSAECLAIQEAIAAHRVKEHASDLSRILFEADKKSRMCSACDAKGQCKKFQNGERFLFTY